MILLSENPRESFFAFFVNIFSVAVKRADGFFLPAVHISEWCFVLQTFYRTSIVAARLHLKTTVAIAYLAWRIYLMPRKYEEWLFISFTEEGAGYHLKRLKRYIATIPEHFGGHNDLTTAETKCNYERGGNTVVIEPAGIMGFKRGQHPYGIICDDILKDPEKKMDLEQIKKVETIFVEVVESMPTKELHVFGTPQDKNDIFKKLETTPDYFAKRYKAVLNWNEKQSLWPQEFPFERLKRIRDRIGEKAFNKEYQCQPVRSEDSFYTQEQLDKFIRARLRNYRVGRKTHFREFTFGGFDIGKHSHPSHLAVFGIDRRHNLIQVHSKFMDGWNYVDQLDYLKQAIDSFSIGKIYYDDTRSEFESFSEAGNLPAEMEGLTFTAKLKHQLAAAFDAVITKGNLMLLKDDRQTNQLLNVDNDLKSEQQVEGHGDSFWSIAMAIKAATEPGPNVRFI